MKPTDPVREYLAKIGRKGGQVKTKKGFALMPAAQREAITASRITCQCGECRTCKMREYQRAFRARRKGQQGGEK